MARTRPERRPPSERVLAGRQPVLELLRAGRTAERILIARDLAPSRIVAEIRRRAEQAAVPVRLVPKAEIDGVAAGTHHQGVVALTARFRYADLEGLFSGEAPQVLFLDGVTDPHNLGALIRCADAAGFSVVIPSHRSAAVNATVRRVAAGATEFVAIARVARLATALDRARAAGLWLVGLSEKASDDLWTSSLMEPPVGIVLGAEDRGLSKPVADLCDGVVKIPSQGVVSSLNVAAAGAIAMFEVARRRAPSVTL